MHVDTREKSLHPAHERTADGLSDATSAGGADDDLRGVFRNSERSDRIGDPLWRRHQARSEGRVLNPLTRTTHIEIDLVVAEVLADPCCLGEKPRLAAANLKGDRLLLVATDRVSAFDVVLPNPVPRKGEVLTRLSKFWYDRTSAVVPSAFIAILDETNAEAFGVTDPAYFGRSMVMRRGEVLKVECVVRGYLVGSGWKEYQEHGVVCGVPLTPGLRMADRLLEPIFTPSTRTRSRSFGDLASLTTESGAPSASGAARCASAMP